MEPSGIPDPLSAGLQRTVRRVGGRREFGGMLFLELRKSNEGGARQDYKIKIVYCLEKGVLTYLCQLQPASRHEIASILMFLVYRKLKVPCPTDIVILH